MATKKAQDAALERYIPQKERDSYDDADFAGPDRSFPVTSQAQLDAAAHLIGHAADPAAVKAKAIAIAKRKGFTLPDAWQEKDDNKERSMGATHTHEALTRADSAKHDPFTGTHSHSHDANDSQGDDEMHAHEHTHDGDNNHDHSHAERSVANAITPESLAVYMPITRYDTTSREVFGQATVEQPDSYGTIFGYYPEAWTNWRGNMREQHDPKKAVGKAFKVEPDEEQRAIYVTSKVSRGAQDTWLKIEDGVLSGYSASVIPDPEYGMDTSRWPKKEYNGKQYPYLPRYTVAELSYVDNPATPGCNISLVRADGILTEVIDVAEEETPAVVSPELPPSSESLDRAGARLSADSRAALHDMRDKAMSLCGCDECCGMQGGGDEPDGDEDMERKLSGLIERVLEAKLHAVYARLQGIAGAIARSNTAPTEASIETLMTSAITRAVEAANIANESSLSEVRASLSQQERAMEAVKATVDRIDATPMPGAPVMHAGALPRPVDKRLPTDPYQMPVTRGATADAVAAMFAAGQLNSTEQQVDAVAAALAAQRRGQ